MWIRTKDLHDILSEDTPGGNSDPGRAAVMRAFNIPDRLVNSLSTSTTKNKIVILAVWQGLGARNAPPTDAPWISDISLMLVDFNRLAILTIIPLENPIESFDSLRPGNEAFFSLCTHSSVR